MPKTGGALVVKPGKRLEAQSVVAAGREHGHFLSGSSNHASPAFMLPCEKGRYPMASPLFDGKNDLAAEAKGLDRLLVAINCRELEIIEQLATTGDELQEATA